MKTLNLTNAERLAKYPSGHCPLCHAKDWECYYVPEDAEHGVVCLDCGEQYPIEQDSHDIHNDISFEGK